MARATFVEPQLATLVDGVPEGPGWIHEVKFDGYRIECVLAGGKARLFTRKGNDWTARFPRLAVAAGGLGARQAVLDGEVVALLPDGRSSFQLLQERIGSEQEEMVYYAFDLLHLDGERLTGLPLLERKRRLLTLLGPRSRKRGMVRYSDHASGHPETVLEEACKLGLEGVVSKQGNAPYQSGRTRSWLKIKCQNRQELIVVGFTEPKGGRVGIGALLLAVRRGKELRYAGKVGTGMNDALLRSLRKRLMPLVRKEPMVSNPPSGSRSAVTWVDARLVVEVSFTEWTRDGMLRHPTLVGLREDKSPREVRREDPMKVAGIELTNADRVLYPEQGLTKADLAAYYEAVASLMLPHVGGRPLSLVRCPEGTGKACFFQKHWGSRLPKSVRTVDIREGSGATKPYAVVDDAAGVVSLVQYGVLEFHLWGSRADNVEAPDRLVFDLDPAPEVPWKRVQEGARRVRSLLDEAGLESWIKTTGGKGIHVVVPIARRSTWEDVSAFARALAYRLERTEPERYLAKAGKAARKGKVFVDWLRNTRGATAVGAWSTRARPGAPISVPVGWEELDRLKAGDQFHVSDIGKLVVGRRKDPWGGMLASKQRLTRSMTAALEK